MSYQDKKRKIHEENICPNVKTKIESSLDTISSVDTKEEMIKMSNKYADSLVIDTLNRNLFITLKTEGTKAFIKKAFEDPNQPGHILSYPEVRRIYG
jgi:hypothetical protein